MGRILLAVVRNMLYGTGMKSGSGCGRQVNDSLNVLRICAMVMVVVLHIANTSDMARLDRALEPAGRMYSDVCESVCIIAVNVFALLTGYLCADRKWNPARYLELLMQVTAYTLLFHCVGVACGGGWDVGKLLVKLFPLTGYYWYFIAYTALFVFIPYINRGMKALEKGESCLLAGSALCVFSLFGWLGSDTLAGKGHGFLWLAVLYVIGAHIRLHRVRVPRLAVLGVFVACCIGGYAMVRMGGSWDKYLFRRYTAPVTSIGSIAFFLLVLDARVRGAWLRGLLAWASPMAFGVYLVHSGLWAFLVEYMPRLARCSGYAWWFIPGVSLLVYVGCTLVDYGRSLVFRWCGVRGLCKRLAERLPTAIKRMQDW